jgi:hypothetical protein
MVRKTGPAAPGDRSRPAVAYLRLLAYVMYELRPNSPAAPKETSAEHKVGEFGDNLGDTKHHPRIRLGLLFALLEDIAIRNEFRLSLDHDSRSDKDKVKEGKHAGL